MSQSPPLAPRHEGHGPVYLVVDDFGQLGRVYRETDEADGTARTVIRDMIRGEFHRPVRVVAFDADQGWARDASAEIAKAVAEIAEEQDRPLSRSTLEFIERHLGEGALPRIDS